MTTNTGGPAFPRNILDHGHGVTITHESGMTLRDYFAAKALTSCGFTVRPYDTTEEIAKNCYAMADAMLKAREA
jgi:hypothetical protein